MLKLISAALFEISEVNMQLIYLKATLSLRRITESNKIKTGSDKIIGLSNNNYANNFNNIKMS